MKYKSLTIQEQAEVEALGIELYDIRQAAAALKVSERSVFSYLKQGKIKGRKLGGKWRFTKADLESYINGSTSVNYH